VVANRKGECLQISKNFDEQLMVFCIHVCSDKQLVDEFITVSIIHGRCTAENCRKTKLSVTIVAFQQEEEEEK